MKRSPSSRSWVRIASIPPIESRYARVWRRTPRAARTAASPSRSGGRPAVAAGRALYGRQPSASSRRTCATPRCGPQNLYGEHRRTSQPSSPRVDGLVRGVVDGVDPRQRAGLARERADPDCVGNRADGVRGPCERDHARPLRELTLEVVEVVREVVPRRDGAHDQPSVGSELDPGRDAAVVVGRAHEDLVALGELAARDAAEGEVQRRHVLSEDDLVGR